MIPEKYWLRKIIKSSLNKFSLTILKKFIKFSLKVMNSPNVT